MIIDFHTHAKPGMGDIADFIAEMDRLGIDKAVIMPYTQLMTYSQLSFEYGDEWQKYIFKLASQYPDRLIPFCSVIPWLEGAVELFEQYVERGARGLKLEPPYQQFSPRDPKIVPVLLKAIQVDVPVLFHTGPTFDQRAPLSQSRIEDFDDLAIAFPDLKMVLAHADVFGPGLVIAAKHPNVYIDTARSSLSRFSKVIPGFGEEVIRSLRGFNKLMLGSDAQPHRLHRFEEDLKPLLELKVDEDVRSQILGGNAAKVLGLT